MMVELTAKEAFDRAGRLRSEGYAFDIEGDGFAHKAIGKYLEALDLYRYAFDSAPEEPAYRGGLESCLSSLHSIAKYEGNGIATRATGKEFVRLARLDREQNPKDPETAVALAQTLTGLISDKTICQPESLRSASGETLSIWGDLLTADPTNLDIVDGYRDALRIVSEACGRVGLDDLSLTSAQSLLEQDRLKLERQPDDPLSWRKLISSHLSLGQKALKNGDRSLAQTNFDEGMQLARASYGRMGPNDLAVLEGQIECLIRTSPGSVGIICPRKIALLVLEIRREMGKNPDHGGLHFDNLLKALSTAASHLREDGHRDEARRLYEEQLEIGATLPEGRPRNVANEAHWSLSEMAQEEENWALSRLRLESLLEGRRASEDEYNRLNVHKSVAACLQELGRVEALLGNDVAATQRYRESADICAQLDAENAEEQRPSTVQPN